MSIILTIIAIVFFIIGLGKTMGGYGAITGIVTMLGSAAWVVYINTSMLDSVIPAMV